MNCKEPKGEVANLEMDFLATLLIYKNLQNLKNSNY